MGDGMVSQGDCTATMLAISVTSKHHKWVDDDHIKLILMTISKQKSR